MQNASALAILNRRCVRGNPKRGAEVESERLNCRIAQEIYALRTAAGLTQAELARRVGTHPSVVCRLEDADYAGHSLTMLKRIAQALGKRLDVRFVDSVEAGGAPCDPAEAVTTSG